MTGGAGFIGSHLCDTLLAEGSIVHVIDDLSTGRMENLPRANTRLSVTTATVGAAVDGGLDCGKYDEIYHLAAAVGVALVVSEPIRSIETNIHETARLLASAASATARGATTRVFLASSSEVYGKGVRTPFTETDDVLYGPTTVGRWSYAVSKAVDEYLGLAYASKHKVPVTIARFFNTVGPRQVGRYGMVLPRFVSSALKGEPITVHGDGTQTRCFCDVRDVAGALPRLLRHEGGVGRVFNLGSDRRVSINELASMVVKVTRSRSSVRHVPYSEIYGPDFEDLMCREPDLSRVRSLIGFAPSRSLETTISDTAEHLGGTHPGAQSAGGDTP